MRNTLLSRPSAVATPPSHANVPSIRLISATPSATGMSTEGSTSVNISVDSSWATIATPLSPAAAPKKRLVPKKSKLSLLNVGKDKTKDFSDVVRRVGNTASSRGGFEIYVDPTIDPDIGEIVMVKKKKSRAALDGMKWGALEEVTNVPSAAPKAASALLKVKGEEKDKWWSIGRGRKDSKDKTKEVKENSVRVKTSDPPKATPRSQTPDPVHFVQEARARFNSLDSGLLFKSAATQKPTNPIQSDSETKHTYPAEPSPPLTYSRAGTPTAGGLLAPPPGDGIPHQGSIALRAMRSVRSIARIGSWAQLKSMEDKPIKEKSIREKPIKEVKEKKSKKEKSEQEKGEKAEKKKKKKAKEEEKAQTVRLSSSSFEVGALASPKDTKTLGKKKHSILGLGLPSTMRLQTVRNGSTASSNGPPTASRLSVESAFNMGRNRAGSTLSSGSSLRPLSTASTNSRTSTGSSTASVRWDEEVLQTVKEERKRDRESRKTSAGSESDGKRKESRRTSEGRRRTPLSAVFPGEPIDEDSEPEVVEPPRPMFTFSAATSDGHGCSDDDILDEGAAPAATPIKKARARPLSEQLLGRSRPVPMYENEHGVLSILDAATDELAQLINNLDLQATPTTPDMTPLRPSPGSYDGSPSKRREFLTESPLKKGMLNTMTSASSLRPYAQSRNSLKPATSISDLLGQQIAPWPTTIQGLSPVKEVPTATTSPSPSATPASTFRRTHKRTMTPGPEPEPAPAFLPLQPSKYRKPVAKLFPGNPPAGSEPLRSDGTIRGASSLAVGSSGSKGSVDSVASRPGSAFRQSRGHSREPSVASSIMKRSHGSNGEGVPISRETRRVLGMSGTMGGSDVSMYYTTPPPDESDPDSDIPDELHFILSGNDRNTFDESMYDDEDEVMQSPSLKTVLLPESIPVDKLPPAFQLPEIRTLLIDDDESNGDLDEGGLTSEEDTKKSFDFTGELKKLNESGGSDRRSFVEQLENAFRTPAKVDLRYDFGDGLLRVEVPPVPKLPLNLSRAMEEQDSSQSSTSFDSFPISRIVDMKEPTMLQNTCTEDNSDTKSKFDLFSISRIMDMKEPTMLAGSDSLVSSETQETSMDSEPSTSLRTSSSSGSRPSDGQLNTSFKFGGLPSPAPLRPQKREDKPVTLSDIIPPPSHVRSLSESSFSVDDDSILKSILAQATDIPEPRRRVQSDSSSKRRNRTYSVRDSFRGPSRPSSGVSFTGFDSFEEVRRGFEFGDDRPMFYPPSAAARRGAHRKQESVFSIASVSSYGRVVNPGSTDPFEYGLPSLQERPSSEDLSISMSMSVDDTFSFIRRQPQRSRVDSDASSFYFKAPQQPAQLFTRGHRRHESNMSVSSQGPPISLYNRSFGAHRRNDSSTSASSVAQSYALFGAGGGRAAWARHRRDLSTESVSSDFSGMHLGRPGLGDKMFDNEPGMHLESISASPPESATMQRFENVMSFDSILDHDRRSIDDSLFDKTGNRNSFSSDSVFGDDFAPRSQGGLLLPGQFRPLSMLSVNSVHSPMKEDDTMISMLGGGHARRRSIGSIIEASPCVRVEKRKHQGKVFDDYYDSPNKARIVEKPSIASTSSYQFGGERMIKAQRGLLERQSLEDSCLIADGEDFSNLIHTIPVFSRPGPTSRSRSSTCTSSSGGDTPPLSISDGASISGGSQSSIDLSHINFALANATHPISSLARNRSRQRAPGHGHRRRYSQAHASRSSVYETIEEEMSAAPSPAHSVLSKKSSPTVSLPVFIVESDTASINSMTNPEMTIWDDERGIVALRKYYALRDEAENTVTDSRRQWHDTPFSTFAVQSFQPPRHPAGMQALLEHSVQNYGPLASELRPRRVRSRTQSRPSPYPQRTAKVTTSPEQAIRPPNPELHRSFGSPVLQQLPVNSNIMPPMPSLDALKHFSPFFCEVEPKRENAFGLAPNARPRVGSTARRTALGWSKRSTGAGKKSTDQKENTSQGILMTPGESLRINRPRPRGRPTPASQHRPIRV